MTKNKVREKIINSTIYLLNKFGYGAVGFSEIARHSKINKQAVYYYFPDPDDILVVISERWSQSGQLITLEALANCPYSKAEKILAIAEGMFSWIKQYPELSATGIQLYQCAHAVPKLRNFMNSARTIGHERIKSFLVQETKLAQLPRSELDNLVLRCHQIMYGAWFYVNILNDLKNIDVHKQICLDTLKTIIE